MEKIPTHKISEVFDGNNAFLVHVSKEKISSNIDHHRYGEEHHRARHAHRDDYYIFFLVNEGKGKIAIDFVDYELVANSIHCIMPGQVHMPASYINVDGCFLAVDSLLVKNEYKEIIEKRLLSGTVTKPSRQEMKELTNCLTVIEERLNRNEHSIERSILSDLISAYIGMIADIYRRFTPISLNNRATEITLQFKSLLTENYDSMKRPSQYAEQMNLSLVYLNEVVKKTTGLSVSLCIREEVILQAKRLLYYTNLTIKEIAQKVGYDDWAYFTRQFTKSTGLSPSEFRKKNLD
ncbi:MAG: AraC family transcriptional regulator [Dysgonomonas sp.]